MTEKHEKPAPSQAKMVGREQLLPGIIERFQISEIRPLTTDEDSRSIAVVAATETQAMGRQKL